ncbi:MAG: domain containing protein [Conexibacter sp.]|nr:domain containing protein [Conexibacter sp.]
MSLLRVMLLSAGLLLSAAGSASAESPVILPIHGALRPGRLAAIDVVAPEAATACTVVFSTAGRRARSYHVPLGRPSRTLRWRVSRHARGTWGAKVTCDTGDKTQDRAATTRATFAVRRRGRARGTLIHGKVQVGLGAIVDRPRVATTARARLRSEPDTSGWKTCGSEWMSKAHVAGQGLATRISFVPTTATRAISVGAGVAGGAVGLSTSVRLLSGRVWSALNGCVSFPGLDDEVLDGIYKQMVCHIVYGDGPGAGSTWDFEAWRTDPSWATALWPLNKCQDWGNRPGLSSLFVGDVVHSEDNPGAAYLVEQQGGSVVFRHILTKKAFFCVGAAGHPEVDLLPQGYFDDYLSPGPDLGDDWCPGSGGGPTGRVSLAQGAQAPSGYQYAVTVGGFPASSAVSVVCRDSVTPGGFKTVTLTTDASGSAATANACYSGDGPDHWVTANGVESNHVAWRGAPPPPPPPPPATYAETTGGETHTWTNYTNAGGYEGPTIASNTTVQVACRVQGFAVADGDTWWYRVAQDPWNNQYYASADAFYNNGQTSGSLHGTPFVDEVVPGC